MVLIRSLTCKHDASYVPDVYGYASADLQLRREGSGIEFNLSRRFEAPFTNRHST